MQEVPEEFIFGDSRERRNSGGSVGSVESTLSNIFTTIPGMLSSGQRLTTIPSDVESESAATSSQFQSASKEQVRGFLPFQRFLVILSSFSVRTSIIPEYGFC
ncbi:unnamed protein product [Gongylonema pulchrum]|uniref:Ovule protein n=1 Tax=Gongylonema pulchrum TaxID=637853 RepID=A0A183D8J4_9BILA|nr:unnamed protein product [Gongylonema pulchrum]